MGRGVYNECYRRLGCRSNIMRACAFIYVCLRVCACLCVSGCVRACVLIFVRVCGV